MSTKLIYTFSFFITINLSFCNSKKPGNIKTINVVTKNNDTNVSNNFIKDIPMGTRGYSPIYYYAKERIEKLNMQNLERGFDSMMIRLWYVYSGHGQSQCISIKKVGDQWYGDYSLITAYIDNGSITSIEDEIIQKTPQSGWDKFIQRLFDLKVLTLRDDLNIAEAKGAPNDGGMLIIEIATKDMYRIYSPPAWNTEIIDGKMSNEIMDFVEKELEFKKLWEF